MKFDIEEKKIGHVTISHDTFLKLRGLSFELTVGKLNYRVVPVNGQTIEMAKTRQVEPVPPEPETTPATLLGYPVKMVNVDQPQYYDEDLVQLLLKAQFNDYTILMCRDENEVKELGY